MRRYRTQRAMKPGLIFVMSMQGKEAGCIGQIQRVPAGGDATEWIATAQGSRETRSFKARRAALTWIAAQIPKAEGDQNANAR